MSIKYKYLYGPVSSRRLGRSLGLDLVPYKICTYDCIYCQLGRTTRKTVDRDDYADTEAMIEELDRKLDQGVCPDYITLAGSGEPTLNAGIGRLIREIKKRTQIPLAVLTNGSLLWRRDLQDELALADLVIPSLDAGDDETFQKVNRPHQDIDFEKMVAGLIEFRKRYDKQIHLEVFLLAGVTGDPREVLKIAALTDRIRPDLIQINSVSRPPCEDYACPISRECLWGLAKLFNLPTEVIVENEALENQSSDSKEATDDEILALLDRRPCTTQGVAAGLGLHINEASKKLRIMLDQGVITTTRKNGELYFLLQHSVSE